MHEADWELLCGRGIRNFTIWANNDFGPCFESLVFGCIPQLVVALASIYHCRRHQHLRVPGILPRSVTLHLRLFITALLIASSLVVLGLLYLYESLRPGIIDIVSYVSHAISWTIHAVFVWRLHRLRHLHIRGTPATIAGFLLSAACTAVRLRSAIIHQAYGVGHVTMTSSEEYCIYVVSGLHVVYAATLVPWRRPIMSSGILSIQDSLTRRRHLVEDSEQLICSDGGSHIQQLVGNGHLPDNAALVRLRRTNADDGVGIWSCLWFTWVGPLMTIGAHGCLNTVDDLFQLPSCLRTTTIERTFRRVAIDGDISEDLSQIDDPQACSPVVDSSIVPDFSSYSVDIANQSMLEARQLISPPSSSLSAQLRIDTKSDKPDLSKSPSAPRSLLLSLNRAFGCEYYPLGVLKFLSDAAMFGGPILLNLLVSYMEDSTGVEPAWHGYAYAAGLSITTFACAMLSIHFNYRVMIIGMKMRAAVITALYRKTLAVRSVHLADFSTGEVVNFMSVDTDRMVNFCVSFHQFWSLPIQIGAALYLLYMQVSIAFLAGLAFAILLVPVNKWLAGKIGQLSQSLMSQKDARVKAMNEILYGIRVIKFYAWEDHFEDKISNLRDAELVSLRGRKYLDAWCVFFWATTPVLISILTFATYVLLGHSLTAAKVFTCIAVFNILITPLNAFPWVLNGLVEAWISLKRVQRFLDLSELDWNTYYTVFPNITPAQHELHDTDLTSEAFINTHSPVHHSAISTVNHAPVIEDLHIISRPSNQDELSNGNSPTIGNHFTVDASISTPACTVNVSAVGALFDADTSLNSTVIQIVDGHFSWQDQSGVSSIMQNTVADITTGNVNSAINSSICLTGSTAVADSSMLQALSSSGTLHLRGINVAVPQGALVGVIGRVGSGKSSLLAAITAELCCESGKIFLSDISEGFGLVNQEAWIQHATVRDNILFGAPFNRRRYERVLEACALLPDIQVLPAGDQTEIGENGVTLSGGQKARIALARAVYQEKAVYLLDDPLSAVDAHVARHLMEQCINGLLHNKTRILVTHQTRFLEQADLIVVMSSGQIIASGPPSSLQHLLDPSNWSVADQSSDNSSSDNNTQGHRGSRVQDSFDQSCDDICDQSALVQSEEKDTGVVKLHVYKLYWNAVGCCLAAMVFASLTFMQASRNVIDWWLSNWVIHSHDDPHHNGTNFTAILTDHSASTSLLVSSLHDGLYQTSLLFSSATLQQLLGDSGGDGYNMKFYLTVYGALAGANAVFTLSRAFLFAYGGIVAATIIHRRLLNNILKATVGFFDSTPIGRIINRFSSDVYTIDDSLPFVLNIFLAQLFSVIGTVAICTYGLPWIALLFLPLAIAYYFIQRYYRQTSRELKRITSITLSPIYAHFSETISGLVTIRALRQTDRFRKENMDRLENNQRASFASQSVSQWLGLRVQMIGVAIVTGVALIAILEHHLKTIDAGLVGLAISYALSVTNLLSGLVIYFTETEKEMVSVERACQYIDNADQEEEIKQPANSHAETPTAILASWPVDGIIKFDNVCLRYRSSLPGALRDLSFETRPGEKIGIVGRTGAGKSSLFVALFRMVKIQHGTISIDAVDITRLPLRKYRSCLAIIPQDPFLFSGSVRENLDPRHQHNDHDLTVMLIRCHLWDAVEKLGGLDAEVAERGRHFSVGQRQLMCLARAMLTHAQILCIDEATASVDGDTDTLLQLTIREHFATRTVLTIAHRTDTILSSDRVMVMDSGQVVEFDSPAALLADTDSRFYSLVNNHQRTSILEQ